MEPASDQSHTGADNQRHSMFVPLLLVVLALLLMTGFQTIQLSREHELLNSRLQFQTGPLEESRKIREQLQAVATSTARLADNGNENAQRIIDQLQKAGIQIDPDSE